MNSPTVFDQLVKSLSRNERHELLSKLGSQEKPVLRQDPLRVVKESDQHFDYAAAYSQLTWVERLMIFFKVFLSSHTREELVEDLILSKLGRKIERNYNNIYLHGNSELRPNFYWNVKKLQDTLFFLREPFRKALGSQKRDFFAFFAGWEMPDIQDRLMAEIDPEKIAYEKSISDPYKLRKEIEFQLEDILGGIDDARKNLLYARVRHLYKLSTVVSFQFDKILSPFERQPGTEMKAMISEVRSGLIELTQVLFAAKTPPAESLMKVVFLFSLQNSLDTEENVEIGKRLENKLRRTEEALSYIRFFHTHIPLLDLSRLVLRNIEYVPQEPAGGEDWYVLFKQFWYDRFEEQMRRYSDAYRKNQLIDKAKEFLKTSTLPEVHSYNSVGSAYNVHPRFIKSIGFIRGFLDTFYITELNSPLKLVLIDGEFYKEQNREEYNDAYNGIIWAHDFLKSYERQLSAEGDIGQQVESIAHEGITGEQRKKKIRSIVAQVDRQMEELIVKLIENVTSMKNVLGGILHGDMGGRYDTLSNMGFIGRNENRNLTQKLNTAQKRIEEFLEVLSELYDSEKRVEE